MNFEHIALLLCRNDKKSNELNILADILADILAAVIGDIIYS